MKKQKNKTKNNSGITLIALVITIIVMLILVSVTISMAVNGGLFQYAGKAVGDMKNAMNVEEQLASGKIQVGTKWYNSIDDYIKGKELVETIDFTIDGTTYQAEEGMTYEQWINSSYNTTGKTFTRTTDGYYITPAGDEMLNWWIPKDGLHGTIDEQTKTNIEDGDMLSIDVVGEYGNIPLNYFQLQVNDAIGDAYYAKEGMTWSEFVNSKLNHGGETNELLKFEIDSNVVGFYWCIIFEEITASGERKQEQTYGSDEIKRDSTYGVNMW